MDDQERRPVTSLREYLSNAKEAVDIFRWVWREATTPQSRRKLYIMFAGLGINIITCTIQPGAIGIIFAGLVSKSKDMVIWGLVLNVACLLGERVTMYFKDVAREWVIGFNWGKLDERITELFFEKSIGQHIHEGSTLSVSNIDKGRWRLLDMQNMLLFEGVAAIAQLIVAFIFLCFLAWFAGLIMGIVIAIYVVWSLYLNLRLNQVCTPIDKDLRAINRHRVERWERVERVKISGKEIDETTELSSRFDQVILLC